MTIKTFCLANATPKMVLPPDAIILWTAPNEPEPHLAKQVIKVADHYPDLDALQPFLGNTAAAFALRRMVHDGILKLNLNDQINIVQHNKFISNELIGSPVNNFPTFRWFSDEDLKKVDLNRYSQPRENAPFLLAQPMSSSTSTILTGYTKVHVASDLLRYTAVTFDLGYLDANTTHDFLNYKLLIPGGLELGIYPLDVFLQIQQKLEEISMGFLSSFLPAQLSPFQRKAVSYCCERMGSYLLLHELRQMYSAKLPGTLFGCMCLADNLGNAKLSEY